jgi:HK97 family phage portal protein
MDKIKSFLKIFTSKDNYSQEYSKSFFANNKTMEGALTKNEDAYATSLYVYACVSKIAEKLASIDLDLYKVVNSRGDTKEVLNHEALDLIYKPNADQTKAEFIENLAVNMELSGEAFILKIRNEKGNRLIGLRNIKPSIVTIVKTVENDVLGYDINTGAGNARYLVDDIIHIKYFNPNDITRGFAPVTAAKNRIETEAMAVNFQRDFFLHNARPDGIIKLAGAANKEQKNELREDWERRVKGGFSKNSRVAILEGGMDYQQISVSQREMDYIDSLKFTRDDILVAFKVPKPVIAITDDVNLANAKTAMQIFLSETINPKMERIVEKLNEELIYTEYDVRLELRHEDPTPENRSAKLIEYKDGLLAGYLSINEVRTWEGLEPIEGGWSYYKPMNMLEIGILSQSQADANAKAIQSHTVIKKLKAMRGKSKVRTLYREVDKLTAKASIQAKKEVSKAIFDKKVSKSESDKKKSSMLKDQNERDMYYKAVNTILDNKAKKYEKAVKNYLKKQGERVLEAFDGQNKSIELKELNVNTLLNVKKEIKIFAEISFPFIEQFFKDGGQESLSRVEPTGIYEPSKDAKKLIDKRVSFLSDSVIGTSADKLLNHIQAGIDAGEGITDIRNRVEELYKDVSLSRAELIARTETTYANNTGLEDGYAQSGVVSGKEWVATNDSRTRDEHVALDGEVVNLGETFSNGYEYPQEPNCRCVIAPVVA